MIDYEKLSLELYYLILQELKTGKTISSNFLKELEALIIPSLNLEPFVSTITDGKMGNKEEACYNYNAKKIIIDLSKLQKGARDIEDYLSLKSSILHPYLLVSQSVIHEVLHAKQYEQILSKANNLETKILIASLIYKIAYQDEDMEQACLAKGLDENFFLAKYHLYLANYELAPEERLAELVSLSLMIKLLTYFGQEESKLTSYETLKLLKIALKGYKETLNPTKTYLEILGTTKYLTSAELAGKDLSLSRRIKLGLEISPEERAYLRSCKRELTKYHNRK